MNIDKNKPSYRDAFLRILTKGKSAIPTIAWSLFLILTTIFLAVNTTLPFGPVPFYIGGALAIFFILGIGILRFH